MLRFIGPILAIGLTGVAGLVASASTPPNLGQALDVQRNLARESPGDAEIQNDLGNLLVLDGRLEEAEGAYRRALEIDEAKISARFNLALLLQNRGKNTSALRQFRKVVDRDPENAWAHYQAGVLYERLGRQNRAVKSYTIAFGLDRSLTDPKVNPHVIQNSLYKKAMLEAYQGGLLLPSPPRNYEDPTRIRGLLVPEIKKDPAPPEVVNEVPNETLSEESLTEVSDASEGSGEETVDLDIEPSGGRIITQESLEEAGPSNQATPGAAARGGRPTSSRGGQRSTGRGTPSKQRNPSVPAIRLPEPPSKGTPRTTPDRGGRTGPRSTGQLEIDLVPIRAS